MEKYERMMELGRGSYGVVWKGKNKLTGELVAIKKLNQDYRTDEECMRLTEVKSLVKIRDHPNVIKLKEIVREHKTLFLVFEYMECDLYQLMVARAIPFSETEIRNVCFQILEGLAHLHRNGFFHRDLKPENILVNKNVIKIADLGLAREISSKPPYTANVTTLWYRAPEVFLEPYYTPAVDLWAVGAIMAELYTQRALFEGSSETEVLYKMVSVLGNPTTRSWISRLIDLANFCCGYPNDPGAGLAELLPTASPEALNLISLLLSWSPCNRPTAMEALHHPYFHGCYGLTVQHEIHSNCLFFDTCK